MDTVLTPEDYFDDLLSSADDAPWIIEIPSYDDDKKKNKKDKDDYSKWVSLKGSFYPELNITTKKNLPSGLYKVEYDRQQGTYFFHPQQVITDELIQFKDTNITPLLDEINSFWEQRDNFKKFKITHKRGILLSGAPGCGKTSLLNLLIKDLMKKDGLIFQINNVNELAWITDALPNIVRKIEPTRNIITIIEDVDKIIQSSGGDDSILLDFLDGKKSINHHICIMTSNNTSDLSSALLRPSRVDMNYVLDVPTVEMRKEYLKRKGCDESILDELSEKTQGFSFAELKEAFIYTNVFKKSVDHTINKIVDPVETKDYLTNHKNKIGING